MELTFDPPWTRDLMSEEAKLEPDFYKMSIVNRIAKRSDSVDPVTLVKDIEVSVVSLSKFLHEEPILRENLS